MGIGVGDKVGLGTGVGIGVGDTLGSGTELDVGCAAGDREMEEGSGISEGASVGMKSSWVEIGGICSGSSWMLSGMHFSGLDKSVKSRVGSSSGSKDGSLVALPGSSR